MADNSQSRAHWLSEEVNDASWIVLYLDRGDANQFRLWMGILSVTWESLRRRADPIEREMYAFIRDMVDASAQVDDGLIVEHCKELVLCLGGLCDPRRPCLHNRLHGGRSRGPRSPASYP